MGQSESRQDQEVSFRRSGSIQRSPKNRKSTKSDQIELKAQIVNHLKTEIDIFAGNSSSARYKEFQEILTTLSKDIQQIKSKSNKQNNHDRCDEVLGQVQNCFQRLETRVAFNEQNEGNLDMASVESHSFINHNFNQKPPPPPSQKSASEQSTANRQQRQPKFDSIKSLDRLKQETQNLEKDVRTAVELEDVKQFTFFEKKIEILYTDLEMIKAEDYTPLSDEKATIGKRLIKCNNFIRKCRKALEQRMSTSASIQDGAAFSKPQSEDDRSRGEAEESIDDLGKIERQLEAMEIQALTFEGIKGDKKYKELEQLLEGYWTKVYSLDAFGNEEKRRKTLTVERTKKILQELRNRAEENEKQTNAIRNLHRIEQEIQGLKKRAEKFQGTTKDITYVELDQEMRALWAKLSEIEEPNEHVRRSKARVINEVQYVLKSLSQESKVRESSSYGSSSVLQNSAESKAKSGLQTNQDPIDDEIFQAQLLNQVKEFQNHWDQLNYNLDVQKVTKSDISKAITDTLEKIMEGMSRKSNALLMNEKRKSTGSLVIAKVIENTDLLKPVYSKNVAVQQKTAPVSSYEVQQSSKTYTSEPIPSYQSYYQAPDLIQQQVPTPPTFKGVETEIKVQPTVKVIGEMQRVGTEAKALLQQIRQSTCTKGDPEYTNFENKLKQCQATLQSIEFNKKSDTIESNRRRANKTINEAFRVLEERGCTKPAEDQEKAAAIRSSRAQEIMDIDAGIQYFRQQIKNFTGVTKDRQYEKIKQGLTDSLTKLQIIDDMHIAKQESIRQIQQYHQELETKLAENQAKVRIQEKNAEVRRQVSQDIKAVIEQVQKLRSQIDRFSGVYDGLHYKQLESNLQSCLGKLDAIDSKGDEKLENAKTQTKQKVQKYLRVLEDKAAKPSVENQVVQQAVVKNQVKDQKSYNGQIVKDSLQQQRAHSVSVKEEHHSVFQEQQHHLSTALEHQTVSSACLQESQVVRRQHASQQRKSMMDPDSPHNKINSLRDKLVVIKDKTETFSGKYKDQNYTDIEIELLNCMEELKLIDDKGHASVIISKDQYADYIEKLMQYFEEKSMLSEAQAEYHKEEDPKVIGNGVQKASGTEEVVTPSSQTQAKQAVQTFKVLDPTEELAIIESKIIELKGRIDGFGGTSKDALYGDLQQAVASLLTKLDNVQGGNVAHVRERKRKLVQELQNCDKQLQEKAKEHLGIIETESNQEQMLKINAILKEIEETSKLVNAFVGIKNDKQYCYLDEILIKLTIMLDNIDTHSNGELRDARKKAIQELQKNMRVLSERATPRKQVGVEFSASQV